MIDLLLTFSQILNLILSLFGIREALELWLSYWSVVAQNSTATAIWTPSAPTLASDRIDWCRSLFNPRQTLPSFGHSVICVCIQPLIHSMSETFLLHQFFFDCITSYSFKCYTSYTFGSYHWLIDWGKESQLKLLKLVEFDVQWNSRPRRQPVCRPLSSFALYYAQMNSKSECHICESKWNKEANHRCTGRERDTHRRETERDPRLSSDQNCLWGLCVRSTTKLNIWERNTEIVFHCLRADISKDENQWRDRERERRRRNQMK